MNLKFRKFMALALSVKEVAERTGFSISTLHYYESIGLLQSVARTPSGHRCYSESDLEWLSKIRSKQRK